MKTFKFAAFICAVIIALTAFGGTAKADYYAPYHPYTYGHNGYWDEHHHYRHWDHYHDHDGYWDNRNGAHIFISI